MALARPTRAAGETSQRVSVSIEGDPTQLSTAQQQTNVLAIQ